MLYELITISYITIIIDMDNKFTWIPFYKELSDWLLEKQNSQPELISTLKDIGITGFRDGTEKVKRSHCKK